MSFVERMQLFFLDMSLMPLLVYENYLGNFCMAGGKNRHPQDTTIRELEAMAKCSDLMSLGDNVQHMCMREQQWGMLHDVGRLCCVLPASLMRGWIHYVAFPA